MSAQQQDHFAVELRTAGGELLPSIDYDGARWFVGESGQEFVVYVTGAIQSGATYKLFLKLDGQGPGYCKIFNAQDKFAVFQGWLGRSAVGSVSYNLFKFGSCKPNQAAATVSNPDDIPASHIEVAFTQVQATGQTPPAAVFNGAGPSDAAASKTLAEGKKWFLAPGLKTEAGSTVVKAHDWNKTVYQTVGHLPSLHVRYDSSEALYLRKALNPRFAPHRAILRRSANPAIAALGAQPEPDRPPVTAAAAGKGVNDSNKNKLTGAAAGAAAAAGASSPHAGYARQQQDATARVKREAAGVKREREDEQGEEEYVLRSATAADRVDLTEEPVQPMTVNGRQLAPDELAVYDLCDSDDEGGVEWQVKKKHQIKVEL